MRSKGGKIQSDMMLMSPAGSRKRPAPGASPLVQHQQQNLMNVNASALQMPADPNLQWHQPDLASPATSFSDPSSGLGLNMYEGNTQQDASPNIASNQVARRPVNHHLVSRGTYNNGGDDSWPLLSEDALQQSQDPTWLNTSDDLEQKAQIPKKGTLAKRRQIPPFVQKLSR